MTTVHTKEQFEQAIADGVTEIAIEGELAIHIHNSRRFPKLTAAAIAALTAGIVAIPLTAGFSIAAVGAVAAFTGIEIALIISVVVLGIGFLRQIWKEWDEVEFDFGPPPKARMRRKPNK